MRADERSVNCTICFHRSLYPPEAGERTPRGAVWFAPRGRWSCARGAVEHHERRPGTRIWPLGTSQSSAREAGEAPAVAGHGARLRYSSAYLLGGASPLQGIKRGA